MNGNNDGNFTVIFMQFKQLIQVDIENVSLLLLLLKLRSDAVHEMQPH